MFKNMTIKVKLILFTILSISGLIVLVFLLNNSINKLGELKDTQIKVGKLKSDMLMLRRNEKDFFLRKDLKYKVKFKKNIEILHNDSANLIYLLNLQKLKITNIKRFDTVIDKYATLFLSLVNQQQVIGLSSKDGLYGSLRSSVQQVQNIAKQSNNYKLLALVYELRKYEKDFMLRKDNQYVVQFKDKINKLILSTSGEIRNYLMAYKKDFLLLTNAEIQIGLNENLGIKGEMRTRVHSTEKLLKVISKNLSSTIDTKIYSMVVFSLIIAFLVIILLILYVLILSKRLISSIDNFQIGLLSFFKYLNREQKDIEILDDSSSDELGVMATVINENIIKTKKLIKDTQKKEKILQEQSKFTQMGEMISMIAHQWRQPLSAISATSGTIQLKAKLNKLDNETAKQLSTRISEYSQHLSATIDDFRDFFKSNKSMKKTNYSELIYSVLNIVEVSLVNQNIELITDLRCKDNFNSYANELKQVIINLIKNATDILIDNNIKQPYIKIKTFKKDDKLILEVCDNGGGIEEDNLYKIFEPYFSTKTKKDGTGIGLYMSKTIIEDHCGGKLSVRNDEFGAIFTITLEVGKG